MVAHTSGPASARCGRAAPCARAGASPRSTRPASVDDTAGYHARHTAWDWSAGAGRAADGRPVAWNLVSGVHDGPRASERTVWLDGVAHEAPPVLFSAALDAVGGLRFAGEAQRARRDRLLLVRSAYRQPFGTFQGVLPGGVALAEGHGVMERHARAGDAVQRVALRGEPRTQEDRHRQPDDALRDLARYRLGFQIAIAAATIGVIYGYDLGNISGALLFVTEEFDLSTNDTEWVATIVVAGSIAGALAASRLANAIGRKPTMMVVALTYAAFAVLSGIAPSLVWLDTARFFLGVTIGLSIVTAPIFVAESAPAAVRGGLIVMYQVATVTARRPRTRRPGSATPPGSSRSAAGS
jgi:hypothetical protein